MIGFVAIVILAAAAGEGDAAPPVRVTIDCGSDETDFYGRSTYRSKSSTLDSDFNVDSFCNFIHKAIPKAVKNGRFILRDPDQDQIGFSDTLMPISAPPPEGFKTNYVFPRFKVAKLKVPKINVPTLLKTQVNSPFAAPKIGASMTFPSFRNSAEDSSVEQMELFKKGVQKMLHVVRVLGKVDHYLSERMRIIVDKLSKMLGD